MWVHPSNPYSREVMDLDVIHVDAAGDAGHLIDIATIVSNVGVIDNPPDIALEVNDIHLIEAH